MKHLDREEEFRKFILKVTTHTHTHSLEQIRPETQIRSWMWVNPEHLFHVRFESTLLHIDSM